MNLAGISIAAGLALMLVLSLPYSVLILPVAIYLLAKRKR